MIWLRYKTGATTESRRINELLCRGVDDVNRLQGKNLRGHFYDTVLDERTIYTLEVGADELAVPACRTFMSAFFCGRQRWLSLSTSSTVPADETFIPVIITGGTDPLTFFEEHDGLPSVIYTLTEKNARA